MSLSIEKEKRDKNRKARTFIHTCEQQFGWHLHILLAVCGRHRGCKGVCIGGSSEDKQQEKT